MTTRGSARPDAVVFDCDGTLVDTEAISERALEEVLGDLGHEATPALFTALLGRPWSQNWQLLQDRLGLTDEDAFRRAYRTAFRRRFRDGVSLLEDAVATARALAAEGVVLGVATSSSRRHLEAVLDLGVRSLFDATVAAEDTTEHKPHPAPYLRACTELGVAPHRAVGIEDSPVGVAAVKAAGMTALGVARPHVPPASLAAADRVVHELRVDLVHLA